MTFQCMGLLLLLCIVCTTSHVHELDVTFDENCVSSSTFFEPPQRFLDRAGVTFNVSNVQISPKRLPLRERGPVNANCILFANDDAELPRVYTDKQGEATGLLEASYLSFQHHFPLALKPDSFWFQILHGVALQVSQDPKAAASVFGNEQWLKHGTKAKLTIENWNMDLKDSNEWRKVLGGLRRLLKRSISNPDVVDLMVKPFSTTTEQDGVAFHVGLLDSAQRFFKIELITMCGIPTVTLLGTRDDWVQLRSRTKELLGLVDMMWWWQVLRPYMDSFVDSFDNVNQTLWKDFFHHNSESGGDSVLGWVLAFFPFINDEKEKVKRNPWLSWSQLTTNKDDQPPVRYTSIPVSHSKVPIVVDGKNAMLLGGFTAAGQDRESGTVMPQLSWAVISDQC